MTDVLKERGILNLTDSFLRREFSTEEDQFNIIDARVNNQIAEGMKKAVRLIVNKLDTHIKSQLKLIVMEEVDLKLNQRLDEILEAKNQKRKTSCISSKSNNQSYSQFNGVRPPSKLRKKSDRSSGAIS